MARMNTTGASSSETSSRTTLNKEQMNGMIRKKAYELFEKRGRRPGHAMEDWLEAERIIKQRSI